MIPKRNKGTPLRAIELNGFYFESECLFCKIYFKNINKKMHELVFHPNKKAIQKCFENEYPLLLTTFINKNKQMLL